MTQPIDVGNDKQLLLDQGLCAQSQGVRLVMNPPAISGEVLVAPSDDERRRELEIATYSSVLHEDGVTRLWYFVNNQDAKERRRLCYAESTDGLHFTRPDLSGRITGQLEPANAVLGDPVQGGCVWIDPNAPPERRYRTQAKWGPPGRDPTRKPELHFYASPDGLRWQETHHLPIGDCDTQTVIFFDSSVGRYVMYTRQWVRCTDHNRSHRKVRRLESDDLVTWDNARVVWEADADDLAVHQTSTGAPPVDCYGACVFKYPGAGDFYVMIAQHFWHWLDRGEDEQWGFSPDPQNLDRKMIRLAPAIIDARLGYSRDGVNFSRSVDRGAFVGVGPAGRFDSRGAWVLPQPVFRDDSIWLYYAGTNRDHDGFVDPAAARRLSGISRAVMRLDGFVSAQAGRDGGHFTTPLLRIGEGELELNVSASAGGCVRAEALDEQDQPIAGFAADDCPAQCADSLRLGVRWAGGGVGRLAGKPIKLRFHLREAKLYAFHVARP